jgi:hypothetical protein
LLFLSFFLSFSVFFMWGFFKGLNVYEKWIRIRGVRLEEHTTKQLSGFGFERICLDLALEIDDGVCKFKMTGLPVCWSSKLHVSCGLGRVKDDLFPHAAKIRTNSFLSEPNKENKCETLGILAI